MPRPRVLSVGQCGYDSGQIGRGLASRYDAEVVAASTHSEALAQLRTGRFDLVMVNRVGDRDGAPGLDLIRALKADPTTASLPILLVSNFDDAQAEAVRAGAIPGFGKADLGTAKEKAAIGAILAKPD